MFRLELLIAILASLVFKSSASVSCPTPNAIRGYYWRDYAGVVPDDALAGGTDHNGSPIYIGQVFRENRVVPGNIYERDNKIHYAFSREYRTQSNHVKILCTQYPDNFHWISTTVLGVSTLTNKLLIVGGREGDYILYVGRAQHQSETGIGRVAIHDTNVNNELNGIYLPYNNRVSMYKNFDILTYNSTN